MPLCSICDNPMIEDSRYKLIIVYRCVDCNVTKFGGKRKEVKNFG